MTVGTHHFCRYPANLRNACPKMLSESDNALARTIAAAANGQSQSNRPVRGAWLCPATRSGRLRAGGGSSVSNTSARFAEIMGIKGKLVL